jgi:putative tricarboxylic transport membrane protein
MVKSDRWIGLFFLFFCAYVCFESVRLELGTFHNPGPGFLSFWSALILGVLSVILVSLSFFKEGIAVGRQKSLLSVALVTLSLFGFVFLLNTLGFVISTLLFISFLLKIVEGKRWLFSFGVACLTVLGSFILFQLLLKTQLPQGFFGF